MKEQMDILITKVVSNKIYLTISIMVISFTIYKVIEKTVNRVLEKDKEKKMLDRKAKTIFNIFTTIIKYVIFAIAMVLILQVHGVNVNSLIAGLGLVSVIAGFALQDPIKDIITGMNIVSDEYFSIGDSIKIDEIEGKVIDLDVRTTKIKDFKTGNILTIANRNISKAEIISDELYIDIPLSYELEPELAEKVIDEIIMTVQKVENVNDAKYLGLQSFEASCMIYKIKIMCKPEFKLHIRRMSNMIIKLSLNKNGIAIPYPQITIHNEK